MAFTLEKFNIINQSHGGQSLCFYRKTDEALATAIASGYFDDMANILASGSIILIAAVDGQGIYRVTNTAGVITLAAMATGANATAAEVDKACDLSAQIQTLTASGAVTAGKQAVFLNHATVVIAATIATTVPHQGLFLLKDSSASGTAAHTCTITTGTWDGTHKVATLNAPGEFLLVYFDASGNGTILVNNGSVALS